MELSNLFNLMSLITSLTADQIQTACLIVLVLWLVKHSFRLWRLERLPSNRDFLNKKKKK